MDNLAEIVTFEADMQTLGIRMQGDPVDLVNCLALAVKALAIESEVEEEVVLDAIRELLPVFDESPGMLH